GSHGNPRLGSFAASAPGSALDDAEARPLLRRAVARGVLGHGHELVAARRELAAAHPTGELERVRAGMAAADEAAAHGDVARAPTLAAVRAGRGDAAPADLAPGGRALDGERDGRGLRDPVGD